MSDIAVRVQGLGKRYRIGKAQQRHDTLRDVIASWRLDAGNWIQRLGASPKLQSSPSDSIWALKDVSFEIQRGEVVGIIGRNGAGKSTLLKVLSRITEPTEGFAEIYGRVGTLLEVGTGFHPELTGRENTYLSGAILGMRRAEIDRKFDEIVAFAEIAKFIDTPVKRYSSGMYVRLAFAVAAHLDPEILIVDEVLAVGDQEFQQKCLGKMRDIGGSGSTVLLVSHNMGSISNLCNKVVWVDEGQINSIGNTRDVISNYLSHGAKSSGVVTWANVELAPGNEIVRLKSVRIMSAGIPTAEVLIDRDIMIEIDYWNLKHSVVLYTSIQLRDETNSVVFASANWPSANLSNDTWAGKRRPIGLFRSTCVIPANLLNSARYLVDVGIATQRNEWQQIRGEQILAMTVHETGEMKKEYSGVWAGVVRPKLSWHTDYLGEELESIASECA